VSPRSRLARPGVLAATASADMSEFAPQVRLFLFGAFAWAWLLWGYWVIAMPRGGLQLSAAFLACALVGGFAPSLAALVVSGLSGGREAIGALLAPLLRWRIGFKLACFAVLLVPAVTVASVAIQALLIGSLRWPDPALLVMALVWPALAAVGEELGWRGFLLPRLEARLGLLPAALVLGVIWGVWHLPADFIALKGYGDLFFVAFLINGPIVLTAHSVIMAWLWRMTGGSTFAAVLYHISITASAIAAPSAGTDGLPGILAAACGAALMWIAALTLLTIRRHDFEPRQGA
jgi:membrane protease YdiL (CAAX protease family)